MGEKFGEISADYEALTDVRKTLDKERDNVKSVQLTDPVANMFGGSARGEWLAQVVQRGHQNIKQAKHDTVEGLHKTSESVKQAQDSINKADVDAELSAKTMIEATEMMSNPLVIFNKGVQNDMRTKFGPEPI